MYSTDPQFASLMALPSRTLSARGLITYPDTSTDSLTSAEIVSLVVHEDAGDHLPLGGISASTLTLKLDNRQGEWNAKDFDGAIINLGIGVYHPNYSATPLTVDGDAPDTVYTESADGGAPDEVFEDFIDGGDPETFPEEIYWANIGTYVAESAIGQEQSTTIEIRGADYLGNYAQKEFTDGQTYPRTVLQILQYACSQAGIALDTTSFVNSTQSITVKPLWEENTTCRDIIGFIACLACGFARIDRDGLLEIVAFDDMPDYTITTARYRNFERQGSIFGPFNALSVYEFGAPNNYGATRIADDINIVDNELNSIAVQGNPLIAYSVSDTLMANMLTALSGLTFTGAKIDWQGDPSLTNGDAVTLTDLGAVDVVVLILSQTLTLDSGFAMSSGNSLKSVIKGKAKTEYMRVFTPTGRLNAAALDGDINIRAGNQLNLLAGADIKVKSGANVDIESGGKLVLSAASQIEFVGGSSLDDYLSGASGASTFAGPTAPTATSIGDLWFDTGNFNVCKRWNGSSWVEYTQGKLGNSKLTIDGNGVAILSGGTFTVASNNFMIDSSGNVSMKGAITADTGYIGGTGGFTIQSAKLYSGKSTLDSATAGVYIGTDGISLGGSGVAPPFKVTSAGALTATSGVIGDFTLSDGRIYYGTPTGGGWFTDFSKWGLAVGQDRDYPNNHFPVRLTSHQDGSYGYFMATAGNVGALAFAEDSIALFSYASNNIYTGMSTRVQKIKMKASNGHIQTKGSISLEGNLDCVGIVTSEDWVDFTPGYKGNSAVSELRGVRNNAKGDIDHTTLPLSARKIVKIHKMADTIVKQGELAETIEEEVDGRSIGMMVSILTKAIQELDERLDKLEVRNGQRI